MTSELAEIDGLADQIRRAQLPSPSQRRSIRKRAKVSLREAAAVLGINPNSLHRWERGEVEPTREHAIAYKRLLEALEEAAG